MKKIAVFLRGHPRTWNYTKDNIFSFFDTVGQKTESIIDYYVALWASDGTDYTAIQSDFRNKNLKAWLVLKDHWKYDAWAGPAHLSNVLESYKFRDELFTGSSYNLVVDTRPDVAFKLLSTPIFPKENEIGTTKVVEKPFKLDTFVWQGLEDHCFMMNSREHVVWNQRLKYDRSMDDIIQLECSSHSKLWHYCKVLNLTPINLSWFECRIIRPSVSIDRNVNCDLYMDSFNLDQTWNSYDVYKKIECLQKANIGLDQYLTALSVVNYSGPVFIS
jgi:hypothetical protein